MLKQRFRERSESWMSSSTAHPPPSPAVGHHAPSATSATPAVHVVATPATTPAATSVATPTVTTAATDPAASATHNPVSILTTHSSVLPAQQQLSPPVSTESLPGVASVLERPRKKLSFRDPEVTSTGTGQKGASVAHSHHTQLTQLKGLGLSDSMENVDLEVHIGHLGRGFLIAPFRSHPETENLGL